MKRRYKQFSQLGERLEEEIETGVDLFLGQRPWLLDPSQEAIFKNRTEEELEKKVENDIAIYEIVEKIRTYATHK